MTKENMQKYCTKCGKEISQNSKFCVSCGAEIKNIDIDNKKIKKSENMIEKILVIAMLMLFACSLILPIFFY